MIFEGVTQKETQLLRDILHGIVTNGTLDNRAAFFLDPSPPRKMNSSDADDKE